MEIWKYSVYPGGTTLRMPAGAEILCVQPQHEDICMWARVHPDSELETRRFRVFGTGHPMDEGQRKYLGTAQVWNGRFVWHVFEEFTMEGEQ